MENKDNKKIRKDALKKEKITCITCPLGCKLNVVFSRGTKEIISTEGAECRKGLKFAEGEIKNPVRLLTTTIGIDSSKISRLPVRSISPVPKSMLEDVVKDVKNIRVKLPVKKGQVLARLSDKNLQGPGIEIISSASIDQ